MSGCALEKRLLAAIDEQKKTPSSLTLNGKSLTYRRVVIPIDSIDLLSWLDAQTLFPKIYWNQDSIATAAIGSAYTLDTLPHFSEETSIRLFGGMDFRQGKRKRCDTTWGDFPSSRYILPLIELVTRGKKTSLVVNIVDDHFDMPPLSFDSPPLDHALSSPLTRVDAPTYLEWKEGVLSQLRAIKEGRVSKVVLARLSSFTFEPPLSPYRVLNSLQGKIRFAFQFSKPCAFIGATPEMLYSRRGKEIATVALAGTRKRGNSREEDKRLKHELFSSEKEQRECAYVQQDIFERVSPLCTTLSKEAQTSAKTPTVQHLCTPFFGKLKEGISDKELIATLHPTPAVGGVPRGYALTAHGSYEPFDRGWYSAPVGWISPQEAFFAVAIRSALVTQNTLHLFAGAGIVQRSIPKHEWEELEHKIKQFFLWDRDD